MDTQTEGDRAQTITTLQVTERLLKLIDMDETV